MGAPRLKIVGRIDLPSDPNKNKQIRLFTEEQLQELQTPSCVATYDDEFGEDTIPWTQYWH